MKNIQKNINGITIEVDYKVQLIGVLIALSDEAIKYPSLFLFNETNNSYINEIKESFSQIKESKIMKEFIRLRDMYFFIMKNQLN